MSDPPSPTLQEHYDRIYRYLRRRSGNRELAEDLTQEVFASAAASLGRMGPTYPLSALLFTIAKRRFADAARRQRRRDGLVGPPIHRDDPGPTEYGVGIADGLRRAMLRLDAEQRSVLVWKLLEGRSFAEIARVSGASQGACRMRFTRALRALQAELQKEGIEP